MGAVQKLATVVMIGLVAMATVFLVYAANEPNRRDNQTGFQDDLAIERGTELFITYCLQCHAPDGTGIMEGTGRIGGILNQSGIPDKSGLNAIYQSDDPSEQAKAEAFIRYRIAYGIPESPVSTEAKRMPSFGNDLNVEQVNDLVYMIMHVDWNYVYNEAMIETGKSVCTATPTEQICSEKEPIAYPTVAPTAVPATEGTPAAGASPVAADTNAAAPSGAPVLEIDAQDVSWSVKEATAKPGDTITIKNTGILQHDFVIDELGIKLELAGGESGTVTIPADAKPGTYTYYCSVPGHKESGMTGTLTVQ